MAIHLTTLGSLLVARDGVELDRLLRQRVRAALFIYLAVERRVPREALTTVFWPDSTEMNARQALRQGLYHLRQSLGTEWVDARAHDLAVAAEVRTDVEAFANALERGDPEAAARLYHGPFLNGVNLTDLQAWESWVDARRAEYAREFRKACREWVASKRADGDTDGAIVAARHWVSGDPLDDEAQHALIEALADAGERAEAIRQYEVYARALEPDGLRPLEATSQLVERVQAEAAGWPARPAVDGPSAPPGRPGPAARVLRPRVLVPGVIVLTLFLVATLTLGQRRTVPTTAASGTTIAVLPFSVRGDGGADYLGEGMVTLLRTALDGGESIRPVDARAVFATVAPNGVGEPDPDRGSRVAARLGAGVFILGEVVQAGDLLHIEAAVYDTGDVSEPRDRAVVSGESDDVFELVDRLAARLLAGLGDPSANRLLHTAAVTTASLPAFKAYLQGDQLLRAGRFERAAEAYLEAIGHDSTFAVAHYRLALTREWAPLPGIDESAGAATRHADRLSPRDRRLLEAYHVWRSGHPVDAERRYRTILARYPDDVEAWFQLGEILFHYGTLTGRSVQESEAAWRQVLFYEPGNLFALPHLARIAAAGNRVGALDSLLAPFTFDEVRADRRLLEIGLLRALAAGDTLATRSLVAEVQGWEDLAAWRLAAWVMSYSGAPGRMRAVLQDLNEDRRSPGTRADLHWFASLLHLANGQTSAARDALAEAVRTEASAPGDRLRWAFHNVVEWFSATVPLQLADSTLVRVRESAVSADASPAGATGGFENEIGLGTSIQVEPLRQYVIGLLSLRLDDSRSAASAADTLARIAASRDANALVRDLDRGLRARIAWHEGRPADALRLLESLELEAAQGEIAVIPFATRANERWLRAEVLVALGRDAEALAWLASVGHGSVPEIPLRAPAHLRQAELHDRLGNRDEAALHYVRFLDLWRDADPQFQPAVDAAKRRLAELH